MLLPLLVAASAAGSAPAATAITLPATRELRLNASQMLVAADRLARAGKRDDAINLYHALAADRDSDIRAEARFRHALLLREMDQDYEAATLLRHILDEKPAASAARIMLAQLLDGMGDIESARRHLRAAQAGKLPPDVARWTERYANALRNRAPYGWSMEIALAPDSNVNQATRSDTLSTVIGDFRLTASSKARSGVGMAIKGSAFTRIQLSEKLDWVTRVQAISNRYRESAFDRLNLMIATGPDWTVGKTRLSLDAGIGRSSIGGKAYQTVRQASLRAYRPLGARTAATLGVAVAKADNRFNDLQDGRSAGTNVAIDRALLPNAGVQLSLSLGRFKARDPAYSTRNLEAGIGGWLDLGRWTLTAAAAHGRLSADERLALFPDKREDRYRRLTLGVTARHLQMFGFSPLARFTVERNRSSVEIWDFSRRRFELGATRSF